MSGFPSKNKAQRLPGGGSGGINEASQNGRQPELALDITDLVRGGQHMPEITGTIGSSESTSNSQQQSPTGNFQSIGALAARLVEKAVQK